jgi:nitrate reductase cytochrome c-type subunit
LPPASPRQRQYSSLRERKVKFRNLSFIAVVVTVVLGLQASSMVNKSRAMPKDIHHATAGRDARMQCLGCHQAEILQALEQMNKHSAKWRDKRFGCLQRHVPASPVSVEAELLQGREFQHSTD